MSDNNKFFKKKNKQNELFTCEILETPFKDEMESMSHPFYALSTKPNKQKFLYESPNGQSLEIIPSGLGMATIMDKDILIYCISHAMQEFNKTGIVPKHIEFSSYDLLNTIGRKTGGTDYKRLEEALNRLRGTTVITSIPNGDVTIKVGEGLISKWKATHKTESGKILSSQLTLSDWTIAGIENSKVKTLHGDYFLLRRPIDKRLYEIVKRHIGSDNTWKISIDNLYHRTGSKSPLREFRRLIKASVESNHLPEFDLSYSHTNNNVLIFTRRTTKQIKGMKPNLSTEAYEKARKAAPSYDVYYLESEWLKFWEQNGCKTLKKPDGAFISFCKKRYENTPNP